MQRSEPSGVDGYPEEPVTAKAPLGQFEVLAGLIEHQAPHLLGVTLDLHGKRNEFHVAVEIALRKLGFDYVFQRNVKPGEAPMPDVARLHTAVEMRTEGKVAEILRSGEFVKTLRGELETAGVLQAPEQWATTSGSGVFQAIDGTPAEPPVKKVEKPAA